MRELAAGMTQTSVKVDPNGNVMEIRTRDKGVAFLRKGSGRLREPPARCSAAEPQRSLPWQGQRVL